MDKDRSSDQRDGHDKAPAPSMTPVLAKPESDHTSISRRRFIIGAGGTVLGAAVLSQLPSRLLASPAAAASSGPTGVWKDQVIMTIEWGKFAGPEADGDLSGTNNATTDEIQRFQYSLDEASNQGNNEAGTGSYQGFGLLGGDLVGMDNHVSHIKDIGVTTVVLYPVVQVDKLNFFQYLPTNYSPVDFEQLDPNARGAGVGPNDFTNYQKVIADLHDTSIGGYRVNVLQDLAMSGIGYEHPWFSATEGINYAYRFRLWDPNTYSNNVASQNNGGPTTFQDYTFIDISATFNLAAFTHSSGVTTGNFDGNGNTYPAEPTGYGFSQAIGYSNYLNFLLGEKLIGLNNATAGSSSAATVFDLGTTCHMAGIVVALAAVGAAASVTFRTTYTDNSYTDTVATIPTWDEPNGTVSDPTTQGATMVQLANFSTMNTPSGPVSTPTYIYGLSLAIDPTKVPSSVTLVASSGAADTRVLAITALPLQVPSRVNVTYNERGFTDEINPNGNLNNANILFPIRPAPHSLYPRYLTSTLMGVWAATTPPSGPANTRFAAGPLFQGTENNVVQALGQKISFTTMQYHGFRIAAFATNADQTVDFQINYTDGTHDTTTVTVKCLTDAPTSSDVVVHEADHALRYKNGSWQPDNSTQLYIFGYELVGNFAKETSSITLPNNPNVHLVGLNPLVLIDNGDGAPISDPTNGMGNDSGTYAYFLSVMAFWLTQGGADGYRIDSAQNFYPSYFKTMINDWYFTNYPNNWMLGEAAVAEPNNEKPNEAPLPWQLRRWQYTNPADGVNFTGVYDFGLSDALRNCFALGVGALTGVAYSPGGPSLESWFWSLVKQSIYWDGQFSEPWNQLAFFDVYENYPFLWIAHNSNYHDNLPLLRLAEAFVFSINRIPMLFSGNEYAVIYGAGAQPGDIARAPGYLFSDDVTGNSVYQDNFTYLKALIQMRIGSEALRSEEKMTNSNWVLQGEWTFGFVRQGSGEIVLALFNNQDVAAGSFTVNLPSGVTGAEGVFNYALKNSNGTYGGNDPDVTWNSSSQAKIAQMAPYEAKIIKVS